MEALQNLVFSTGGLAVIGGLLLSVIIKIITHKIEGLGNKAVLSLLGVFSVAASGLEWFIANPDQFPSVIGQNAVTLLGIATVGYRFLVKPVYESLQAAKAYRQEQGLIPADDVVHYDTEISQADMEAAAAAAALLSARNKEIKPNTQTPTSVVNF